MHLVGINPEGRVFDYKRISKDIEIGLIEDPLTLQVLWRMHDKSTEMKYDFNEEIAQNVFEFEQWLRDNERL